VTSPVPATAFHPRVPYESCDLSPLRGLPPETYSRELYHVEALIDALVDSACLAVLSDLGVKVGPVGLPVDALADVAGVAAERRGACRWIVSKLRASSLVEESPDGREILALRDSPWSEESLLDAAESSRDLMGSTADLVREARLTYPDFLRGRSDGRATLFGPRGLRHWERYFQNGNVSYATVNRLAAEAAARAAPVGPLAVLEVGGGLGSGTEALLDRLGDRVKSLCFTDVVPHFVARSRETLRGRHGRVEFEFRRVDLDEPLLEQGIAAGAFDLVLAVNTLHAVRDIPATLRELGGAMRADGTLVLGEAIRPRPGFPIPIEFVFRLTPEFNDVATDPECRSSGGFLHFEEWRRCIERAGLTFSHFLPDLRAAIAAYPSYDVAAIVASQGNPSP
jgi:SAM-dependent methyltransferase